MEMKDSRLGRRNFIFGASAAVGTIALASTLAACSSDGGGSGSPKTLLASAAGRGTKLGNPKRGGHLRVAMIGNGTSETLNTAHLGSPIDAMRAFAVYDPLVRSAPGFKTEPGLAINWEHNDDGTEWRVGLRKDVTWHDGKPFTADDVIYTWRQMGNPDHVGHSQVADIDLDRLSKDGDHSVIVPLKKPIGRLYDFFVNFTTAFVIQNGTKDFSNPIGTGPFKVDRFIPGERTVLSAHRDYWDPGRPYLDQMTLLSFTDQSALENALLSKEADVISPLSYPTARANLNTNNYQVIVSEGGPNYVFYMRMDREPFDDVRVRQAMRLIADRQALINASLSGFGEVMNDLPGKGLPFYNGSIEQRKQDIAKAKSLLKAAGKSDLQVILQTAPSLPGFEEAALVFAEQAKKAGVTVTVKKETTASYFNHDLLFMKMDFAQDALPTPALAPRYKSSLSSEASLNEVHRKDPSFDALLAKAIAEPDLAKAAEYWNQLQQREFDEGGYIVWAGALQVNAAANNVRGISGGWWLGLDDFRSFEWWLA